jgi:hypothetical protein
MDKATCFDDEEVVIVLHATYIKTSAGAMPAQSAGPPATCSAICIYIITAVSWSNAHTVSRLIYIYIYIYRYI